MILNPRLPKISLSSVTLVSQFIVYPYRLVTSLSQYVCYCTVLHVRKRGKGSRWYCNCEIARVFYRRWSFSCWEERKVTISYLLTSVCQSYAANVYYQDVELWVG